MTNDTHHVPRLGFALVLQAIVAFAGAVVITFSPDHSPFVGLIVLAVVTFLLTGGQLMTAVSVAAWPRAHRSGHPGRVEHRRRRHRGDVRGG